MKNKVVFLILTLGIAFTVTIAGTFFAGALPAQAIESDVVKEVSTRICPVAALENHIAFGHCMNCITDEQCPAIQFYKYAILNEWTVAAADISGFVACEGVHQICAVRKTPFVRRSFASQNRLLRSRPTSFGFTMIIRGKRLFSPRKADEHQP